MKVLFVYPNGSGYSRIPMGLAVLVTYLKHNGHTIKIFDTTFYKTKERTDDQIRESLGQVRKADLSSVGVKFEYKTKEGILEELHNVIADFSPDLCAFSVNEELTPVAYEMAEYIKHHFAIPVIFGGIGVTTCPQEVIEKFYVDMICLGEGEEALLELVNKMEQGKDISGIQNIWLKNNGDIIKNEPRPLIDLNKLPFLDLDDFSEMHFFRPFDGKIYRMLMFDMIRGCPYRCSYCDNHILQDLYKNKGKYIRKKSVQRSIDELIYLKDKYNVELLFFIDDDFCIQTETEMSQFLKAYRDKVVIPFVVQARPDTASEKKLRELKRSGCLTICMSIESGNNKIRKSIMNRNIANDVIINAFRAARSVGLKANSQNIIGNPDETRREIFETIEVNRKCRPYSISTNFMTPFKGTKIREMCVERGYIDADFMVTTGIRGKPVLKLPQITNDELLGIQKNFSLYVKLPRIVFSLIRYCERKRIGSDFLYKLLTAWMWKQTS